VRHRASPRFWKVYRQLPTEVRALADRNYALLKADPAHGSLHFKKTGNLWSVRVGLHYRALATAVDGDLVWFWIGSHAEYDRLLGRKPAPKPLQPESGAKSKAGSRRRRGTARS
jgi:hypothetical protein